MKFKNIKLVIFDVDGTLVDSSEYFFQAYEHTLKTYNHPPKTRDELATVTASSNSLLELYTLLINIEAKPEYEATHRVFWSENLHLIKPYKNTVLVLKALRARGIKIALLTNRKSYMRETLERVGLFPLVDYVVTKADVSCLKPHPEGIRKILKHFALQEREAVIVGDTQDDISAGYNAGIYTVWIPSLHGSKTLGNHTADVTVSDLADILSIV